jgi:hypothetical protein
MKESLENKCVKLKKHNQLLVHGRIISDLITEVHISQHDKSHEPGKKTEVGKLFMWSKTRYKKRQSLQKLCIVCLPIKYTYFLSIYFRILPAGESERERPGIGL